ncbi:P-loop NTPase fold protein [Pseudomonas deceptionensis]|uniref:P-loop NTPase fold protein n=1 Tax=Pseudomonas deceptionensis TaxID=882211 RepID=UPI000653C95D|nr:P-loop NTPase fold protein [Pseudomonas deceptionensis]KMM77957.1 hypothetical protein TR67_20735 [Pseudomonas deceptionensis]
MDELGFANDRPIKAAEQDLLGRSAFAKNLAAAIVGWKNQECLVIALTGPWGSGRSSIKNLAIQELIATPHLEVIEHNPWEWTAQEKLSESFFDEVSRAIRRKEKQRRQETGQGHASAWAADQCQRRVGGWNDPLPTAVSRFGTRNVLPRYPDDEPHRANTDGYYSVHR